MAKEKIVFFCTSCGYESSKWLGKCPGCNNWNTFSEEKIKEDKHVSKLSGVPKAELKNLKEVVTENKERISTGYEELDRVLGGGIVDGSLILFGGEPGIGKSTLLLQVADSVSKTDNVLYVSGEESDIQVKLRADRLKLKSNNIMFYGETNIDDIEEKIEISKPKVCIIDSIQTMYDDKISSTPGSVSQVREVTARLLTISKRLGIICIVVGHVTKEGTVAGPRLLEHMVDVVMYIEGDRQEQFRIIRGVKNRFGSTNEIGIFEMTELGLLPVDNTTDLFISEKSSQPGTAITAMLEGSMTLFVEVQALTTHSYYNMPRRVSNGYDINRLFMLLAVIEKTLNINIGSQDVYLNVTKGVKITETAGDLGIVMAIISSYKGITIKEKSVYIGEVSLTGEIRTVINIEKRVKESLKLGFKHIYIPAGSKLKEDLKKSGNVLEIANIRDIV